MTAVKTRKSTDERKNEILNIALKILHDEGVRSFTLREIADRIGISEAAIFRHFGSKKEIMDTLASMVFDRSTVNIQLFEGRGSREAISLFLRERIRQFRENPMITTMLFREDVFETYPEIRSRFTAFKAEVMRLLIGIVERGISEGELSSDLDPRTVALIIRGSLRSMVMHWRDSGFSYDLQEAEMKLEKHLLRIMEGG